MCLKHEKFSKIGSSAKPIVFSFSVLSTGDWTTHKPTMDDDVRSSMSSSARYSSEGDGTERLSLRRLSKSIFNLLSTEELITTKCHILAATKLLQLIQILKVSTSVPQKLQIELICVATSLFRRVVRLRCKMEPSASDSHDEIDFSRTLTLVFVAITAADLVARGGVPADESMARQLDEANEHTTWQQLCKFSKRRHIAEEIDEAEKRRMQLEELVDRPFFTEEENASWVQILAQPGNTAAAVLARSGNPLIDATPQSLSEFLSLSFEFVRATVAQMHFQLLRHECGDTDRPFVTLSTHRFVETMNNIAGNFRDDHIDTIVNAGESEVGQSVRALSRCTLHAHPAPLLSFLNESLSPHRC